LYFRLAALAVGAVFQGGEFLLYQSVKSINYPKKTQSNSTSL
jgi:hypothetical protein